MNEVVAEVPNAILFILDPLDKNVLVPPYVDGELVACTENCISVGTQSPVDGATQLSLLVDAAAPLDLKQAFKGTITSLSGCVAVVASDGECLLKQKVEAGTVGVAVFVDDFRNPAHVVMLLRRLAKQS